jgi:aconitate hydratase
VIAQSYERIHRSNLIGMGIAPLQFEEGESVDRLGLSGEEVFDINGLATAVSGPFEAGARVAVTARRDDGSTVSFKAILRLDTPQEAAYYRHGGILTYVLRQLAAAS